MTNKQVFDFLKIGYVYGTKRFCSSNKTPIISCKHRNLDFYGQSYPKNQEIPLASRNWLHRKSKGDFFIIHRGVDEVEHNSYLAQNFNVTGLSPHVVQAADKQNIIIPTHIQYRSIHKILAGYNTLVTAETGCGKTWAYMLPLLDQVMKKKAQDDKRGFNSPLALVLAPSRELVTQIYGVIKPLCTTLDLNVRELIGGFTKKKMLDPVVSETDIIVATPGIFSKFLTHHLMDPSHICHVVLDEADTLLDDSFEYKLTGLLKKIKYRKHLTDETGAQLTLVSATVPSDLSTHLSPFVDPESILKIVSKDVHKTLPNLPQRFLRIGVAQKPIELLKLVRSDVNKRNPVMVFCNKTNTSMWLTYLLNENGAKCVGVNGDMNVMIRSGKYAQFDSGEVDVLCCTDMLSRGMDTTRTKHVINYDFPTNTFDYLHRIGRTGRIGSSHGCYVTNFISKTTEILLTQKIEMSVRKLMDLPSVDGNIKKMLRLRTMNRIDRVQSELNKIEAAM